MAAKATPLHTEIAEGLTATMPRTTRVKLCFTAGRLPRKNPAPTNMIVQSRAPATLYAPNLQALPMSGPKRLFTSKNGYRLLF